MKFLFYRFMFLVVYLFIGLFSNYLLYIYFVLKIVFILGDLVVSESDSVCFDGVNILLREKVIIKYINI